MHSLTNSLFNREYTTRSVEPYRKEHLPAVRQLALDNLYKLVSLNPGVKLESAFARNVEPCLKPDNCLVALEDERLVGFVTYEKTPRTVSTLWRSLAEVHHLAVDSTLQKQGHGKVLLREALSRLEKDGVEGVTLRITDFTLERYYEKFGFRTQYLCKNGPEQFGGMFLALGQKPASLKDRVVLRLASSLPRYKAYSIYVGMLSAMTWLTSDKE